jgi:S1-C subfamily serine protease
VTTKTLSLTAIALVTALAGCGQGTTRTVTAQTTAPTPEATTAAGAQTTHVEVLEPTNTGKFAPEAIFARAAPGVVTIISAGLGTSATGQQEGGLGTGFVISDSGEIATNAHVVTSGEGRSITQAEHVYVRFPDGNQIAAKVLGFDPFADVALIKIDTTGLKLRPLPLGTTKGLKVGAPVAAIGSPFGEEQSLSVGVVSATDRSIDSLTGFSTSGAIQTDAAINHGNSGGPLLDAQGRVLGINSQIRSDSGDGSGVGFAVPVDAVKHSIAQLRASGHVSYAFLGVSSRALYPQVAARFHLPIRGVWVQDVSSGGPADRAGIRAGGHNVRFQEQSWAVGGDVILAVDGNKVTGDDALAQALIPDHPGQTITLKIFRDGKRQDVKVKLGTRPLNNPPPQG